MNDQSENTHIQEINGWKFKYHYSHTMKKWIICIINEKGVQVTGAHCYVNKDLLLKDYPQLNFK